jgi:Flp pilus assembly protein TadD
MGRQSTISLLVVCGIICFCFGIYANSLKNNFVNWDDPGLILKNNRIRSLGLENIREMFTLKKSSTFQPIRVLSYAIDYRIWEFNPMGYRVTNILLYTLTCVMVFYCLRLASVALRGKKDADSHFRVGLFGALLFAAHPVHVEAVTWLSARKEVLQGFFFFLAFYLYLKGREGKTSKKAIYLSIVLPFFLLAVLSKNSAVVFPGGIILYELTRGKEKFVSFLKEHWVFMAAALVVSGIFTFILMKVMIEAGGIKPYYGDSFLKNILVCIYAFLRNIKLLIATLNYSAAYSFAVTLPVFHIKNIAYVIITFLLFGLSIFSLRWTKVIFFSLFFFFITILPYLNIIPISTLLADRYVFIASFSYVLLLGILFDRLYDHKYKGLSKGFFKLLSVSLFLFILTAYSFITIQQNKIWENNYTLWADAIEKSPNSNTANAMMGIVYMDLGMDEKAVTYLEKAVEILPYDYQSRNNLGIVYGRMEQPEKALKELMTAIWLKPDDDTIKINLSAFYQKQKEYKKAEDVLKSLLSKNANNADLHFRLGMLYKEAGQFEAAVKELLKSMELAPHIINPYEEVGNIYASKFKDLEKARYYYSRGIEAVPKAKSRIEDSKRMIQDLENNR